MSPAIPPPVRIRPWAPTIAATAAFIMAVIPGLSFLAWIPAISALVLGMISLARDTHKTPAVAGIVLGTVAWMIAVTVSLNTLAGLDRPTTQNEIGRFIRPSETATAPPRTAPAPEAAREDEREPFRETPGSPEPTAPLPTAPSPIAPQPLPAPPPPVAPIAPPPAAEPVPVQPPHPPPPTVSYKNCAEARAAGAAPIRSGSPGYGKHLDRDGDGIGCE